jgi:hypothetical protein
MGVGNEMFSQALMMTVRGVSGDPWRMTAKPPIRTYRTLSAFSALQSERRSSSSGAREYSRSS